MNGVILEGEEFNEADDHGIWNENDELADVGCVTLGRVIREGSLKR